MCPRPVTKLEFICKTMISCFIYLPIAKYSSYRYKTWSIAGTHKEFHMMTSSNGIFSALLAFCIGNSPVTGEFPPQRLVARSCDVFFDLRLNKRWSTESKHRWLETPSRPFYLTVTNWMDAAEMWSLSPLDHAMICRLFRTKSVPKPMMI